MTVEAQNHLIKSTKTMEVSRRRETIKEEENLEAEEEKGKKDWIIDLDTSVKRSVRFVDNSVIMTEGAGKCFSTVNTEDEGGLRYSDSDVKFSGSSCDSDSDISSSSYTSSTSDDRRKKKKRSRKNKHRHGKRRDKRRKKRRRKQDKKSNRRSKRELTSHTNSNSESKSGNSSDSENGGAQLKYYKHKKNLRDLQKVSIP
ncbi:peptidyl-prolyl cis-trans isomerase CYP95-like [Vigna angularis]|uniref:peptidyl-prolyl cis-trans isomerase CYP95-like n=1 Tax=Phaseolus angularis TaxID=3914 RepID=UPI00080A213A|nr:peptidyl-prolyl cis-trans isomerase CYP95-like [Vigna angularis]